MHGPITAPGPTPSPEPTDRPAGPVTAPEPRAAPILALWMVLIVAVQAALWGVGARSATLAGAVERGAANVERRTIGEVADEVVRKAIALQHDTVPFWTTIAALGDFGGEPLALALRASIAATLFAGLALLRGRPVQFAEGLASCAWNQGYWVLGMAVRLALAIALRRPEVETSAVLLLPPGPHDATTWAALRELDAFALMGWTAMALGAIRRGQVRPPGAIAVCLLLFLIEAATRASFALVIGAGMRLTILPEA